MLIVGASIIRAAAKSTDKPAKATQAVAAVVGAATAPVPTADEVTATIQDEDVASKSSVIIAHLVLERRPHSTPF